MAVFKVKKGDTYESIARRSGVSAGAVMRYFKGRPLYKGMTYNTTKLAGMVQGGQAYAALSPDINPWGLGVGDIPDIAWETQAGTDIAENYLAAIGYSGFGYGVGEEGVGITTSERIPVEEAPQALTGTEQLTTGAGGVTTPELGEEITLESLTGAGIGPQAPSGLGPPGQPSPISLEPSQRVGSKRPLATRAPQALGGNVAGLPAGMLPAAQTDLGFLSLGPVAEGLISGLESGFEMIGEAFKPKTTDALAMPVEGQPPTAGRSWQELYFGGHPAQQTGSGPGQQTGSGQPPPRYGREARGTDALEVIEMMKTGKAPLAISPDVANMLGYSDEKMDDAGYVFNSETGQWELDMSGAGGEGGEGTGTAGGGSGPSYGGGYGGYSYGRPRRGGYGGRRSTYGNTFNNGQVNTSWNWRIGWN